LTVASCRWRYDPATTNSPKIANANQETFSWAFGNNAANGKIDCDITAVAEGRADLSNWSAPLAAMRLGAFRGISTVFAKVRDLIRMRASAA
jgi:hypothetical protein